MQTTNNSNIVLLNKVKAMYEKDLHCNLRKNKKKHSQ